MRYRVRGLLLAIALMPALNLCAAQEMASKALPPHISADDESVASLRRIPGLFMEERNIAASVTIITAEDIRRSNASTIQELIAKAEGSTFSDQQGFGLASDGTLNLRGIVNSSRTNALVLLDGVRQKRITGDEVHW